jgi:hypothetical protein
METYFEVTDSETAGRTIEGEELNKLLNVTGDQMP